MDPNEYQLSLYSAWLDWTTCVRYPAGAKDFFQTKRRLNTNRKVPFIHFPVGSQRNIGPLSGFLWSHTQLDTR
jgi:hypothetical protein